jgi:hypothetical protein
MFVTKRRYENMARDYQRLLGDYHRLFNEYVKIAGVEPIKKVAKKTTTKRGS